MTRRIFKVLGLLAALMAALAAVAAAVLFAMARGGDCFPFGDSFDELRTVSIGGQDHYLYRMVSGFQDKVVFFALSPRRIDGPVCGGAQDGAPRLHISSIDDDRPIQKLRITRDAEGGFVLEAVHAARGRQSLAAEALARVPVEVDGKLQPPPR